MALQQFNKKSYIIWGILTFSFGVFLPVSLWTLGKFALEIFDGSSQTATVKEAPLAITTKNRLTDQFPYVPDKPPEGTRALTKDILRSIHQSLPKRTSLHVNSQAFLVVDLASGEILIEKNKDKTLPVASLTKLLTALVALDVYDPNQIIKIPKPATAVSGSLGLLKSGERVSVRDLLHALLMQSANDAAEALALSYGRPEFIKRMNQKARFLDADVSTFTDPSGLSNKNVSSAADLLKITRYMAAEKPELLEITRKKTYKTKNHTWINPTKFLALGEYRGGKIGFTTEAGRTAVSLFELEPLPLVKRTIAVVLLKSNARDKDILSILDYIDTNALLITSAN